MEEQIEKFRRDICNFIILVEALQKELKVLKKRHYYHTHANHFKKKITTRVKRKCLKMEHKKLDKPFVMAFE